MRSPSNRRVPSGRWPVRPAVAPLLTAACLIACGGCGGRDPAASDRWSDRPSRLIVEPPAASLEAHDLYAEEVVFELDLTAEAEHGRWRRTDGAGVAGAPRGLRIPSHEEGAWLLGTVPGAADCDVVVADTTWIRSGSLELVVTPEETPAAAPSPAPIVAVGREVFEKPAATRFRFPLHRPEAEGQDAVAATTVALRQASGDQAGAVRLRCLRQRSDPAALAETLSRPWKVDLGGEVRFAVPALDGQPVAFRAAVPERALLRFGYGVPADHGSLVGIEIAAGGSGAQDGDVLFRAEEVPRGAWLDAEVDLRDYGGRELNLELRTVAEAGRPGAGALAFFAHPVVVGSEPRDRGRPPNVLVISVDTLRADHLELYGYERETMPNLTAWARREAVVFERVVAQAPWTLPSHVSMLTGLDALTHGVNYHRPAPEALLLLPEILYAQGYRTLAVTGGAYLDPQFGLDQGFERFRYFRGQKYEDELDESLAVAVEWLREVAGRPFVLFFHTYDVHEPYFAREPDYRSFAGNGESYPAVVTRALPIRRDLAFQSRREMVFLKDRDGPRPDPNLVRAMYDSGIAHTDRGLHRLLGELDDLGIADRTIVIFTSDHGEALGEHGLAGHGDLYDHTVLVPLIVKLPGREAAGERIVEQVRSIDIVPTLLDLLRLPAPSSLSGLSLLPIVRGARRLPDGDGITYEAIGNQGLSIRNREGHKYVLIDAAWKPTAAPTERLFDLGSDPAELRPSTDESPPMRRLRREAQRWLRDAATGVHVRFWNPGDEALCGVLVSDLLRHNSVKVPAERSFAHWLGAGRVRLSLPAGEQTNLIVLDVAGAALSLRFEAGACGPGFKPMPGVSRFEPLVVELPLTALTTPRWHRLEAGRWQQVPGGAIGGADAVLSVAWVGPLFAAEEGSGVESPGGELEERLRALGYL